MTNIGKSVFFPLKNKTLAKKISIKSPSAFAKSIKTVSKNGVTPTERKSLVLAETRARLQLRRKNLSDKERIEFEKISKMKIPKVTRRK